MTWTVGNTEFEADNINPQLAVSPWNGHRQFAYDLLNALKPQTVVELGTHYGCSFFAFLQSCKDFHLDTEVIAIDSWEGDPQAGFYGDEVWDTVNKTLNQYFANQNFKLIRKYFDDAVNCFEEESIDIIHIDGLHTYEAVKNDFEKWLPKLKEDGIILFHDVASEKGYGTNAFWDEMCDKYDFYYTFTHSWGLGVLFPKGDKWYRFFEKNNFHDKVLLYKYFAEYKLQNRQLKDHIRMVEERDKALRATEELVRERDKALKGTEELVRERDKALKATEELVRERDKALKATEELVRERDKALKATEEMVRTRDEALMDTENLVEEKVSCIEKMQKEIAERDIEIENLEKKITYLRNRGLIDRIRNREV